MFTSCIGDCVRHLAFAHCRNTTCGYNFTDFTGHKTFSSNSHGRIGMCCAVIFPRARVGSHCYRALCNLQLARGCYSVFWRNLFRQWRIIIIKDLNVCNGDIHCSRIGNGKSLKTLSHSSIQLNRFTTIDFKSNVYIAGDRNVDSSRQRTAVIHFRIRIGIDNSMTVVNHSKDTIHCGDVVIVSIHSRGQSVRERISF